LQTQLKNLWVPFVEDFDDAMKNTDHIVDAVFGICSTYSTAHANPASGFSFKGEVREPFPKVIEVFITHLSLEPFPASENETLVARSPYNLFREF
jgi:NAD(P)H-hydrate repair Nnr-like enzyme with NAD(P)H-hydrate epimerase domain